MTGNAAAAVANGEHRIRLGGIDLRARVEGRPGAEWLTFSHSIATDLGMWDEIIPALAERHRILRYDTRGHGGSSALDEATVEATNFDALAGDVVGLLDHFGIARTDFVGVSLGGMTALALGLKAPDRIRSLTVIGARADMPAQMQGVWSERIASVRGGGMEAQVESTLARWFTSAFLARETAKVARIAGMIRATPVSGYVAAVSALRRLDYLPLLGAIRAPTLLLCGVQDEPMLAPSKAMEGLIPGAHFAEIADASHLVPVEQPGAIFAAIQEFLRAR
jgi:3-oxoadipate enol-lactonase